MIRWLCPNGACAAKLGPKAPRRDASVRFCLTCSATSDRLVARVPAVLERARTAKEEARAQKQKAKTEERRKAAEVRREVRQRAKEEKAKRVAESNEWRAQLARERKADYVVTVYDVPIVGQTSEIFDHLRGRHGALARVRELQRAKRRFELTAIRGDTPYPAVAGFHGRRLAVWYVNGLTFPGDSPRYRDRG